MLLFTNFLLTFMLFIGSGIVIMPILAAATNVPDLNGGSTLITVTKTTTTSAPTPSPTFTFICPNPVPNSPIIENCDDIYNKCITNPKGHDDHFHCMLLTCYTYAIKCRNCKSCQGFKLAQE